MDWYDRNPRDFDTYDDDDFGDYNPQFRELEDWEVPGPYTGMGPSDYIGQDTWIYDQINQRLMAHGHLDASDIEVAVADGIVTLTGLVDSRKSKRMAEDTVDSVLGVVDVNNELKIKPKQHQEQHQHQQEQMPERHTRQHRSLTGQRAPWDRY